MKQEVELKYCIGLTKPKIVQCRNCKGNYEMKERCAWYQSAKAWADPVKVKTREGLATPRVVNR